MANFPRASSLAKQKFARGLNVMILHQPKVQRFIKRDYSISCEIVFLRKSVISAAYSSL